MQRVLKDAKLLETAERVTKRIAERFPESGLSQVAAEVVKITQEAAVRAAAIRRPNVWLRAGLIVLLAIAVAAVGHYITGHADQATTLASFLNFLDTSKGMAAYLGAIALFLVTLETRLKRRRALQANLRALRQAAYRWRHRTSKIKRGRDPHANSITPGNKGPAGPSP